MIVELDGVVDFIIIYLYLFFFLGVGLYFFKVWKLYLERFVRLLKWIWEWK